RRDQPEFDISMRGPKTETVPPVASSRRGGPVAPDAAFLGDIRVAIDASSRTLTVESGRRRIVQLLESGRESRGAERTPGGRQERLILSDGLRRLIARQAETASGFIIMRATGKSYFCRLARQGKGRRFSGYAGIGLETTP